MIDNLLDTHTLIWYLEGDNSLSRNVRNAIESEGIINFISIASLWEIAIKLSIDKLKINVSLENMFDLIQNNGFVVLPITPEDTFKVAILPFYHRDPFDRLIIAQAMNNDLKVLTRDENFKQYDIKLLW